MTAPLSVTDAILAHAAASTGAEMHAARMALLTVKGGAHLLAGLDRTGLLAGDGTAGNALLGGSAHRLAVEPSCARRSNRILLRLAAARAEGGEQG